jgi:hypothetical protein
MLVEAQICRAGFRQGCRSRHWSMPEAKKASNFFTDVRSPVLQHDIGGSPSEMLAGVDRDHLSGHVARSIPPCRAGHQCGAGRSNKTRSAVHAPVLHARIPKAWKSRLPDCRGHKIQSDHAPPIKSMAFHGLFAKLVMGGLPARLRRCRPDAPRSAAAAKRNWEDFEARTRSKNSKQEMDMGLLRFAKSVGTKIFGATETATAPPEQLKQEAAKHGLDVSKVEVKTEGDNVILSGSAASTEEAEKITLAIGNSVGVATVQNDLAAAAEAPGSKFYTVKPGDSLWKDRGGRIWPRPWRRISSDFCSQQTFAVRSRQDLSRPSAAGSSAFGLRARE